MPSRSASVDERPLEVDERRVQPVDRPTQPQPQVGRDLVVARATRVQLAGQRPDPVGQRRFEVEVDVLEVRVPRKRPVAHRLGQALEPGHQLVDLFGGEQPGTPETAHVRDRPGDVIGGQLPVELDRAREIGHPSIVRPRRTDRPRAAYAPPSCAVMLAA